MVFVVDAHKQPLMPCTEKRARLLLDRQRAVIHQMFPFTIRVKDRAVATCVLQDVRVKLDPGSQETGVAITLEGAQGTKVIFFGVVVHKAGIRQRLKARRSLRRGRRARHTRYRPARVLNRRRPKGWLPPSLTARVDQTLHAVAKIRQFLPVTALTVEDVAFDTQKMQDPEIRGVEYQQGTLLGYEVREYLLMKWNHHCAYCDATDTQLTIDHVHAQARGGSHRVSNLVMACKPCNGSKDTLPLEVFLATDAARKKRVAQHARKAIQAKVAADEDAKTVRQQRRAAATQWEAERLERIQRQLKLPLKDAAAMNATRWRLYALLRETGLSVERGTGGRTKMQRIWHRLPKTHYYDALCVGQSTPAGFTNQPAFVQVWSAKGRGSRQLCRTDKYGFPIRHLSRVKQRFGFQTGDLVRTDKRRGKHAGIWVGRVTARPDGRFVVTTGTGLTVDVSWKACRRLQRNDGWQYTQHVRKEAPALLPTAKAAGSRAGNI